MAVTNIRGQQILNGDVGREDLNTTTTGRAVITKAIGSTGISLSSTGTDAGTGDVTISFANISANTILGNNTAGTAVPTALTTAQVTALLDLFSTTATTKGLVPGSNGVASTNFLCANGTWAVPAGGGGGGGISTVGTIDSQTKSADGAVITGSSIVLQTADATNVGLVSTAAQTLAGAKTFSSAPTFSTMTSGRLFFAGTGGLLSQNANLFWDNTNGRLGITTSSPQAKIHILTNFSSSDWSNKFPPANDSGILLANDQTVTGDVAPSPALIFKSNGFFTTQRDMRWKIWGTGDSGNSTNQLVFASADSGGGYVNRLIFTSNNFGLNVGLSSSASIYSSTVTGAQTQIRIGGVSAATYRTTNAGSNITPLFATSIATTSGTRGWCADTTNGSIYIAGNGTNPIARAAVSFNAPVNTAGSETGELTFFTQNSGAAMAERMRIFADGNIAINTTTNGGIRFDVNGTVRAQGKLTVSSGGCEINGSTTLNNDLILTDGVNVSFGKSTGTKLGSAIDDKLGFYGKLPVVQIDTTITGVALNKISGNTINENDTFDGYTVGQIVAALRKYGLLA